ncbi:50S ribosomal protein L19 [Candidatus Kaiserbacteria bacterium CG10_big_fil_rev_8_21_14_0_10_49_17]|uniref:50S ribosomal protein L19 n=1 Tax=Candidatus Kaiserbacteria bacterium CG10_big_fil_rev_8_21_14_0_10_49_17 TaxID=1974609 RepID=A0A2M6WDP9_9BACT|nr:MAG: 50S ribosomal protein L19 [Candidatus Kaiserbacteria bacterium CG10_big_fil_rev_8_21_14_0_10_49_17]
METAVISPVNIEARKSLGIKAGDTVRVWQKIEEKGKTRLQAFEGLVLARKHGSEPGATFTVRRVSSGVGIEKIFPLYSPSIDKIEIVKRSKVRRAKLYHIRDKVAREIKRQMRRMSDVSLSTGSDMEEKVAAQKAEEEAAAKAAEEKAKAPEEVVEEKQEEKTEEETTPADPSAQTGEVEGSDKKE